MSSVEGIERFADISTEAREYFWRHGFLCVRGFLSGEQLDVLKAIYRETRPFRKSYRNSAVQRFQPLERFDQFRGCLEHLDSRKISALGAELTGADAFVVQNLFGAWTSNSRLTYILPWHRDIRDNSSGYDYSLWDAKRAAPEYFLQFNLPIFDDASFWVVPGSHARPDTPAEAAQFAVKPVTVPWQERFFNPWLPKSRADQNAFRLFRLKEYALNQLDRRNALSASTNRARLQRCVGYAHTMPAAVEVAVQAGDILFYRGCSWHTAIYRADVERFTFFSNVRTRNSDDWYQCTFLPSRRAAH